MGLDAGLVGEIGHDGNQDSKEQVKGRVRVIYFDGCIYYTAQCSFQFGKSKLYGVK